MLLESISSTFSIDYGGRERGRAFFSIFVQR